jgi:hypothetical protein
MCELLAVGKVTFQPVRHALQQPISRVAAELVVDHREMVDVEDRDREARETGDPAYQKPAQALAEQRPLGQARQRFEVGKEFNRLVLVEVLKGKRQVGGDFLE